MWALNEVRPTPEPSPRAAWTQGVLHVPVWLLACVVSGPLVLATSGVGAQPASEAAPAAAQPEPVADPPHVRKARAVTERATVRFEAGDYETALVDFLQAYELLEGDPRQVPLLNNIAVCYERLFRYARALEYYERYLARGPRNAADRQEVEQVVAGLRGLLGQLSITSNVPAEVWVGQQQRDGTPVTVLVPAGDHVIEVAARGHESQRREVRVAPRSEQRLHFELEPLPRYEGVSPRYFWVGTGLTAAALVVGTAYGAKAVRLDRKAEDEAADGVLLQERNADIERLQRNADIGFGTAALFGVSTLVLFFLTDWSEPERASIAAAERRFRLGPQAGPGQLGLQLWGSLR